MHFKNLSIFIFIFVLTIPVFNLLFMVFYNKHQTLCNCNDKNGLKKKSNIHLINVVYIHFVSSSEENIPEYLEYALKIASLHNNSVHLISNKLPKTFISNIIYHNLDHYIEYESLTKFKNQYLPLGISEPWEQHNFERYFILQSFMEKNQLNWVFYADSDVIILKNINTSFLQPNCDSFLIMPKDETAWNSIMWVAWAGTAFIRLDILQSFTEFTNEMYSNSTYHSILNFKHQTMPYVCDMTLWYLFVVNIDKQLSQKWNRDYSFLLPQNKISANICDIGERNFDHKHGHLKPNSKNVLSSIHFQGDEKNAIKVFYQNMLRNDE